MFRQTWKKYMPVITILLKRSAGSDQQLSMNNTDFERAAAGRKIKFSFSHFQLNNGKLNNPAKQSPLVKDFVMAMQEDTIVSKMLSEQQLEFSMNNEFHLHIKNITVAKEPEAVIEGTEAEAAVAEETENNMSL